MFALAALLIAAGAATAVGRACRWVDRSVARSAAIERLGRLGEPQKALPAPSFDLVALEAALELEQRSTASLVALEERLDRIASAARETGVDFAGVQATYVRVNAILATRSRSWAPLPPPTGLPSDGDRRND